MTVPSIKILDKLYVWMRSPGDHGMWQEERDIGRTSDNIPDIQRDERVKNPICEIEMGQLANQKAG